ncbi:MAG: STAS domain-containing protein [Akkermansia sp.]|nr:STAS domain-containing protein [Akkermansia sp.]
MMTDSSLTYHEFDDCLWIRCTSRGSFINSPSLKSLADKYLDKGKSTIVVDLEVCPGVDSTFMGTLAGLARRCLGSGGSLQVATPTQRTRAAMESLGLDMLLDIDPPDAAWQFSLEQRRQVLQQDEDAAVPEEQALTELARTRHVLEAHNTLRSMNKKNDETFGYVCETLEEDLLRHSAQDDEEE